jgi:Flp pilus assembly protein TadB
MSSDDALHWRSDGNGLTRSGHGFIITIVVDVLVIIIVAAVNVIVVVVIVVIIVVVVIIIVIIVVVIIILRCGSRSIVIVRSRGRDILIRH